MKRSANLSKLVVAGAMVASAACGPSATGGDGNGDGNGTGSAGADGGNGGAAADARPPSADAHIPIDASCGAQTAEIPLVEVNDPPDLLIVLDASGSMSLPPGFPFSLGDSKWQIMTAALQGITNSYDSHIRFGLSAFPISSDECGVGTGPDVPIGISQAGAINGWMGNHGPTGSTPAHLALQLASSIYASEPANPSGQYVLFATDGVPTCGGDPVTPDTASDTETLAAVQALANQGVHTFVLGFGDILGLDPDLLNDAAQAGGEPKAGGPPYFYHADNASELQTALSDIAGGIIIPSCSFEVTETPPDPDLVTVTIDGMAIPRDPGHASGWDYYPDDSTITFFGSSCDAVQEGDTSVSFVFGCPGPSID
jgi:hypothetical protein